MQSPNHNRFWHPDFYGSSGRQARNSERFNNWQSLQARKATGRENIRTGIAATSGLLSLSQGMQAVEALRYGQLGNAAMHGAFAAGAGWMGYQSWSRSPWFAEQASKTNQFFMKRSGVATAGSFNQKLMRNLANWTHGL